MDVLSTSVAANGKKRKLNGKTDYTIGFGRNSDVFDITPPNELHLVAIEAKCRLDESDLWQCVAETATLYKSRKDLKKKKCAVFRMQKLGSLFILMKLVNCGDQRSFF
jgi:hypothetical protein